MFEEGVPAHYKYLGNGVIYTVSREMCVKIIGD